MAKSLELAQQRNFAKWEILGRDVTPNYFVGDDYAEEVNWMKQWIEKHYHQPSDEYSDEWDLSGAAADTQLLFFTGLEVAQQDAIGACRTIDERLDTLVHAARPRPKLTLHIPAAMGETRPV